MNGPNKPSNVVKGSDVGSLSGIFVYSMPATALSFAVGGVVSTPRPGS